MYFSFQCIFIYKVWDIIKNQKILKEVGKCDLIEKNLIEVNYR